MKLSLDLRLEVVDDDDDDQEASDDDVRDALEAAGGSDD